MQASSPNFRLFVVTRIKHRLYTTHCQLLRIISTLSKQVSNSPPPALATAASPAALLFLPAAPSSVPPASEIRHLPIICLTSKASPDDLRSYMSAGMDGCVSKPAEPGPLLNTLRAAVPLHLSPLSTIDGQPLAMDAAAAGRGGGGGGVKVVQGKGMGVLKGSAACAAEGMALAARREDSVEGALQVLARYIKIWGTTEGLELFSVFA